MAQIREILVLHHSHLDVGYTHSQPIIWEMQREFIDQALALLDDTSGFPGPSQPKWTCEVTGPLLHWLDDARDADAERFRTFVRQGRIGICAMQYNTTPLSSAELLSRQLGPTRELREQARRADLHGHPARCERRSLAFRRPADRCRGGAAPDGSEHRPRARGAGPGPASFNGKRLRGAVSWS